MRIRFYVLAYLLLKLLGNSNKLPDFLVFYKDSFRLSPCMKMKLPHIAFSTVLTLGVYSLGFII